MNNLELKVCNSYCLMVKVGGSYFFEIRTILGHSVSYTPLSVRVWNNNSNTYRCDKDLPLRTVIDGYKNFVFRKSGPLRKILVVFLFIHLFTYYKYRCKYSTFIGFKENYTIYNFI